MKTASAVSSAAYSPSSPTRCCVSASARSCAGTCDSPAGCSAKTTGRSPTSTAKHPCTEAPSPRAAAADGTHAATSVARAHAPPDAAASAGAGGRSAPAK